MTAAPPYVDPPPFTVEAQGQKLVFYPAGKDRLAALIAMIESARESIRMCFYIFAEDASGVMVRDALAAAAARGVDVHLIIDGFGADARKEFFAPLVEAAEKAQKTVEVPTDAIAYVTLEEATEGTPATPGQVVKLNHDSIVLRILESGDTDRLVWVDGGLEVLAAESIIDAGTHNGTVLDTDSSTEG